MAHHTQKDRLYRIDLLFSLIGNCGEAGANEKKLIAEFSIQKGTAERKIKEYLLLLEGAGKIKREDGIVYKL